jgi:serine/threonine protein kinase
MLRMLLLLLAIVGSLHASDTELVQLAKELKISPSDVRKTATYIETHNIHGYLPKSKSHLAIEKCSSNTFIVLDGKRHYLGRGTHKKVYKAIHYKDDPEVVARGVEKTKEYREYVLTKKLQGKPGIFSVVGMGKYKKKGKVHRTLYAKLYRSGSLHDVLEKRIKLSLYEKVKLAQDMLTGVKSLHDEKIVHLDLAARNFLVDIPKGKPGKRSVVAAVADLGHALYVKDAWKTKVSGNTRYTAPEGLFINKMKRKDYYKTDIYAVGCVLYWLKLGKRPSWCEKCYVNGYDVPGSLKKRYWLLKKAIKQGTKKRRHYLAQGLLKRTPAQQFEHLILKMLHTNPNKRGSANYCTERLNSILQALE